MPLLYVIRENDQPDNTGNHPDFVTETVACAQLTGEYYMADRTSVFNMIVSFTTGQPSGYWIISTLRYYYGRRSMEALRRHFSGEDNATRNLAGSQDNARVNPLQDQKGNGFRDIPYSVPENVQHL